MKRFSFQWWFKYFKNAGYSDIEAKQKARHAVRNKL
tara:strand:- start:3855 stop:3962 length:108 start_codon:yes stop_codon:yes gene_type:complete